MITSLGLLLSGLWFRKQGISGDAGEHADRRRKGENMKPLHRKPVNKHKSAKTFRHGTAKTKAINVRPAPMRGGIRM